MTDHIETIRLPKAFGELLTRNKWRAQVYYGGRGGAKSHALARAILIRCMQERTRAACLRETMNSLEDSVFKLLCDLIDLHRLHGEFKVTENKIRHRRNKSEIIFKGLTGKDANIKSLEGADIAWVEEAEGVSDPSWEVLIPTIRKEGSEIWVSFNTRFVTDPTYQRFIVTRSEDTLVKRVSWRDNPFFTDELRREKDKLLLSDPVAYMHVWEGEPDSRREGYIYPRQLAKMRDDKRVGRFPYDPAYPVYVGWDIGFGDAMAVWFFQIVGREPRFIHYYEAVGEQISHFLGYIRNRPYVYADRPLFFPHDGAHGNARGDSPRKQAKRFGYGNIVFKKTQSLTQDIDSCRALLDYCVIDEAGCAEGIQRLSQYQYKYDNERKVFSKNPLHNPASNGADAFRTCCMAVDFLKGRPMETVEEGAAVVSAPGGGVDLSIYRAGPTDRARPGVATWMGA